MKIKVTLRLHPVGKQHRYRVTCDPYSQFNARGDLLPDLLEPFPSWVFPTFDRAFSRIRDARPWLPTDETVTITIEIK